MESNHGISEQPSYERLKPLKRGWSMRLPRKTGKMDEDLEEVKYYVNQEIRCKDTQSMQINLLDGSSQLNAADLDHNNIISYLQTEKLSDIDD